MSEVDWTPVVLPIAQALVMVVAGLLTLGVSGLLGRLKAYFDSKGEAHASQIVTEANERIQAAMANAAGEINLQIAAGKLRPWDLEGIRGAAMVGASAIAQKLPDAIRALNPARNAIAEGIAGKVGQQMAQGAQVPAAPLAAPAPAVLADATSFESRAAIVRGRLVQDLGLLPFQASAIIGSLGEESGLREINEIAPRSGRGGFGWAQWTGPRRVAFEAQCQAWGMLPTDPEANYRFLVQELQGSERASLDALRQTGTLEEATRVFEEKYERPAVAALDRRLAFAKIALGA